MGKISSTKQSLEQYFSNIPLEVLTLNVLFFSMIKWWCKLIGWVADARGCFSKAKWKIKVSKGDSRVFWNRIKTDTFPAETNQALSNLTGMKRIKKLQKKSYPCSLKHLSVHLAFLIKCSVLSVSVSVCLSSVEYDFRQQERHLLEVLNRSPRGNKAFSTHLAHSLNISMLRNTIKNLTKSKVKSKKLCKTLFNWLPRKIQQR